MVRTLVKIFGFNLHSFQVSESQDYGLRLFRAL
jgi:hypothetical protein